MTTKTMTIRLDDDDFDAIQREIARYQSEVRDERGVILPEGESCLAGAILAESIRSLEDYREQWTPPTTGADHE